MSWCIYISFHLYCISVDEKETKLLKASIKHAGSIYKRKGFFLLRSWQKLQQSESGFFQALLLPAPVELLFWSSVMSESEQQCWNGSLRIKTQTWTCFQTLTHARMSLILSSCLSAFLSLLLSCLSLGHNNLNQIPLSPCFWLTSLIDLSF